jgi:hypothetical protein
VLLLQQGWAVRGTSRSAAGLAAIEAAGIEPASADPDRPGTVLEQVGDVAIVAWLMGSASGEPDAIEAINGFRLESLLEKFVDTPVRGVVYEAEGSVGADALAHGAELVEAASERWRIPARILRADPAEHEAWAQRACEAVTSLLA